MRIKTLFFIVLVATELFAGTWSSSSQSGIQSAYSELDQLVREKNEQSARKWEEIEELIDEISKQTKKKEQLLAEINALQKEQSSDEEQILFLMEQEKNLLNNYGSISASTKE